MPITDAVKIAGCAPFSICHGSPFAVKESLYAHEENSKRCLDKIDTDYLFCGHTHAPFVYEYNGKFLVNCASVGMPVNAQTDAHFAIIEYTNGKWNVSLVSLPYDIDGLLDDFEKSGKALDYIQNPDKTDNKMLVSSFGCSFETADIEFAFTLSQALDKGNNLAHHLIQSFAPGEADYQTAHEIGRQLADAVTKGQYEYVLTTHIDETDIIGLNQNPSKRAKI